MKFTRIFTAIALVVFLASCGGDEKKGEDGKGKVTLGSKKTTKKNDSKVNLALIGNDLMKFDKTEFRVKAGQEVTLTLRHAGKGDIKIMGHNFVLLNQGVGIPAFAAKAAAVGQKSDWIPEGGKDVIAHTKMIGGGQTATVTFTAPAAGTYDFICSFPGHSGLMKGKFIVE